jgi:hypothetical protein
MSYRDIASFGKRQEYSVIAELPKFLAIGLILLTTACQTLPGFNLFSATQEPDPNAPRSNFVAAQGVLLTNAGQPVLIESHHIGVTKLMTVEITINNQPPRTEATAGQANVFPQDLATIQVLERDQPTQPNLQSLRIASNLQFFDAVQDQSLASLSPACQELLRSGGPIQANVLTSDTPSSRWTVCHLWIGRVPGTYDLSVVAIDEAGRRGQPVVQRIEVR